MTEGSSCILTKVSMQHGLWADQQLFKINHRAASLLMGPSRTQMMNLTIEAVMLHEQLTRGEFVRCTVELRDQIMPWYAIPIPECKEKWARVKDCSWARKLDMDDDFVDLVESELPPPTLIEL